MTIGDLDSLTDHILGQLKSMQYIHKIYIIGLILGI